MVEWVRTVTDRHDRGRQGFGYPHGVGGVTAT